MAGSPRIVSFVKVVALAAVVAAGCGRGGSSTAAAGVPVAGVTTTAASGAADHDHDYDHDGSTSTAAAAAASPAAGVLDVEALHDVDMDLSNGTLDAPAQRVVVAAARKVLADARPATGSKEAALVALLDELDLALAAGDVAKASPLASKVHDAAHDLEHGHGH